LEGLDDRSLPSASLDYALGIGSTGQEWPSAIAADAAGDVFLAGHYRGDVNFDPRGATPVILSSPTAYDSNGNPYQALAAFLAKYHPDGTLAWAKGGADWAVPYGAVVPGPMAIAVDGAGDVYFSGSISHPTAYGPTNPDGTAYATYTPVGTEDAYVMKLDSAGNLAWAQFIGGAGGHARAVALAVDAAGNVTTAGVFQQTATFGTTTLTAKGSQDSFVSRIDPAGDVTWTGQIGGNGAAGVVRAVALDDQGSAYVTGDFVGTVDFDPGAGTMSLSSGGRKVAPVESAFVLKLDAGNRLSWAEAPQTSSSSKSVGYAIAVDADHNVYVAGSFEGTVDFDPSKSKHSLTTTDDASNGFVYKLSPAGQFAWVKSWGVSTLNPVTGLGVDGAGNVYVSGTYGGTVDFDPGPGTELRTGAAQVDTYVLKLDAGGNFIWVATFGGPGLERSWGLAIDGSGNAYTTGFFEQTINLDPDGTTTLTSAGSQDVFLVKFH
jgi:hypothetical protein